MHARHCLTRSEDRCCAPGPPRGARRARLRAHHRAARGPSSCCSSSPGGACDQAVAAQRDDRDALARASTARRSDPADRGTIRSDPARSDTWSARDRSAACSPRGRTAELRGRLRPDRSAHDLHGHPALASIGPHDDARRSPTGRLVGILGGPPADPSRRTRAATALATLHDALGDERHPLGPGPGVRSPPGSMRGYRPDWLPPWIGTSCATGRHVTEVVPVEPDRGASPLAATTAGLHRPDARPRRDGRALAGAARRPREPGAPPRTASRSGGGRPRPGA